MSLGIGTFTGEVKFGRRGRTVTAETRELREAIAEAAKTGTVKMWPGAGKGEKEGPANAVKVRNIGKKYETEDAPLGYFVSPKIVGDDLVFMAEVRVADEEKAAKKATEEAAKATEDAAAAKPTPTPTPPKKAPAKRAASKS